jgi:putative FmdB family regulatory protein
MPFYEYQCKSCGHTLEAMQKINDVPLKKCPDCGKSQLTRLMSAPVFRLKGGGWYETDFKGDGDNKKNLADRPEAVAKDDKTPAADAKTDAKTDAKADATAKDASKPAEKAADKPAEKAAPVESKKAEGGGMSKRGATAVAKPAARPKPSAARPKRAPARKAAKSKKRR